MTLFKQPRDFSKHEPAGVLAASIEMQLEQIPVEFTYNLRA
jgi:hypothetical protein